MFSYFRKNVPIEKKFGKL